MNAVNAAKLNQTKAPNEMKRAALGDIASNRIHSSRLPVLKTGFVNSYVLI